MKNAVLCFMLIMSSLVPPAWSAVSDPESARLVAAIEARLEVLFQERDVLATDHAVLLATRYRRLVAAGLPEERQRAALTALLAACAVNPPRHGTPGDLVRVATPPLLVDAGDRASLSRALAWALAAARRDSRSVLPFGRRAVKRADLIASLALFARLVEGVPDSAELARQLVAHFDVYRSPGLAPSGDVLFTAYHDPVFEGRLAPDARYRFPVYREPSAVGVPNNRFTRAEVARGALSGRKLEIAYLADPLDTYLLEVEGSGLIRLPDGRHLKLEFAAKNGQPYKSLGKTMVRLGMVKPWEMSIPAIRRALVREPARVREVLDQNPSQIYFQFETVEREPRELAYVAQRSVACDQTYFPRAGIGFALLERPDVGPDGEQRGWVPHHRFIVNHDTGSAIRGPGHIDLYWGHDEASGPIAGSTREPGELYTFLKRGTPLVARR